jgi:hypothetical protein
MKTLEVIQKTKEYLDYVEEHVKNVQKAWEVIKKHCTDLPFVYNEKIRKHIDLEIELHDLSKLSAMELVQYRNNFYPCDDEPKNEKAFARAWEHHKHNNHHHWEMWTTKIYEGNMKAINTVHNVCDWVAMGIKFGDSAIEYYENNKSTIDISAEGMHFMADIFDRIYDNKVLKC